MRRLRIDFPNAVSRWLATLLLSAAMLPPMARTAVAAAGPPELEALRQAVSQASGPAERRHLIEAAIVSRRSRAPSTTSSELAADPTPALGCGEWSVWFPDTKPFARSGHAIVYDPTADRLIVFGGINQGAYASDVWTLNLGGTPAWAPLATTGSGPGSLDEPTAIYDASRNRIVVYGGQAVSFPLAGEVWSLSLGGTPTWSNITPAGPRPGFRYGHAAIYDASRDRMVIFGGYLTSSGLFANDAWALALAPGGGWTALTPAGSPPAARMNAAAIYDAPRDRMIVCGGLVSGVTGFSNEVWSLSFAGAGTWSPLAPSGPAFTALGNHTAILDAPRDRMIVLGGYFDAGDGYPNLVEDVWRLDLTGSTSWAKLAPGGSYRGTSARHGAVYDPIRERMVVFGGEGTADETWALTLNGALAWNPIPTAGGLPIERYSHTMILDAPRSRVVMFGGINYGIMGDVWTHSLSGPGTWTRLYPTGAHPRLIDHCAVYDSVGQRMIVYGGLDERYRASSDVWALTLTGTPTWSKLSPSGSAPTARSRATGVYDRQRRRLLVWGGLDSLSEFTNDLSALSLAGSGSWSSINRPGPDPTNAGWVAGVYDVPRDRVVFAGPTEFTGQLHVWDLPLGAGGSWTHTLPTAQAPTIFDAVSACLDPAGNRMLLHDPGNSAAKTYALNLAGTLSWSRVSVATSVAPPRAFYHPPVAYDPSSNRMILAGGYADPVGVTNGVWALDFPPGVFSVDAQAVPFGGSASVSPYLDCPTAGSTVTVTATPDPGFTFVGWTGGASGTTNPLPVLVDGPKAIQANFVASPPACDSWRVLGVARDDLPGSSKIIVRDSNANRLLTFGYPAYTEDDAVWAMSLAGPSDWQQLTTTGTVSPGFLLYCNAVFDPVRNRVVMYGSSSVGSYPPDEVWDLTLTGTPTFHKLVSEPAGPPVRSAGTLTYDPVRDRLLLFGGIVVSTNGFRNDLWSLNLSGPPVWTQVVPAAGPAPAPRYGHTMVYDSARDRMLVFGGRTAFFVPPARDVWSLSLSGTPTWTAMSPLGTPPSSSMETEAIYDPLRDRMVVIGGESSGSPAPVSALSLRYDPFWTRLTPDGAQPSELAYGAAVYDYGADRAIVVAAYGPQGVERTYALSFAGGAWLDVYAKPSVQGSVAKLPAADCYPLGSVVTLTATPAPGYGFARWSGDASGSTNPLDVTLDGDKVIVALFDAATPVVIERFTAVRDAGGVRVSFAFGAGVDVREVTVERAEQEAGPWTAVTSEIQRPDGGYLMLDPGALPDRAWCYRLEAWRADGSLLRSGIVTVAAGARIDRTELALVGPNPGVRVQIQFTVAREQPVRLSVVDVTGREVALLDHGVRPAGRYSVGWGLESAGRPHPGIYFLRFATRDRTETRRIALVP